MLKTTIGHKINTLRTFYLCLQLNPLNYEEHEKERIYYEIFKDAILKGLSVSVSKNILYIDNRMVER
jgi:hypothetical protein